MVVYSAARDVEGAFPITEGRYPLVLITCPECQGQISDTAVSCPSCGWVPSGRRGQPSPLPGECGTPSISPPALSLPVKVTYDRASDTFAGTMVLMVKLAMCAVQEVGWKLDSANEVLGLVTFKTGMTWGSFAGVTGSLNIEEVSANRFRVTGTGQQNNPGGKIVMNLFGEAEKKVAKVIRTMAELATSSPQR